MLHGGEGQRLIPLNGKAGFEKRTVIVLSKTSFSRNILSGANGLTSFHPFLGGFAANDAASGAADPPSFLLLCSCQIETRERLSPRAGIDPFPTSDRRVSGSKKMMMTRTKAPKAKRNQKRACQPYESASRPPTMGPICDRREMSAGRCRIGEWSVHRVRA